MITWRGLRRLKYLAESGVLHGLVAATILLTLSAAGTAASQEVPKPASEVPGTAAAGRGGLKLPSIEDEMLQAIQRSAPGKSLPKAGKSGDLTQQAVESIQPAVKAGRQTEPRRAVSDTAGGESMNVTQFRQTVHDLRTDYLKLKREQEQLKQVIERLNQRHDRLQRAYNSLLADVNQAMAEYEDVRAYRNGGPRLYGLDTPSPLMRASRPAAPQTSAPVADALSGLGRRAEPTGRPAKFPPDFTN